MGSDASIFISRLGNVGGRGATSNELVRDDLRRHSINGSNLSMKTRRFGLLAFFTISMTLVVWSIIAPGKQAQADSRLNSPAAIADLPAHLPLDTPTVKMAYTTNITFTPSITAFLPLINRFFPEPTGTITGQITYQGAPTAGISVTLFLWYNPTTYIRFRTATSQANGTYQFSDVPNITAQSRRELVAA
jgi:hypothetical protein